MKFLQIVLATVLSTFLVGQSFANAPEERILAESTKEGNWQQFLQNLSQVKMGEVTGYDPDTNTIYTAAVLVWVCQNQAPAWQAACTNKPERFAALKARNGWGDTITGADLKAQGQGKGIFFPFATASASTPTPTPVTAAPVVAKAPEPVAPAITAEQLKEIARATARGEIHGLTKALGTLNARMDGATADAQAITAVRKAAERAATSVTEATTIAGKAKEAATTAVEAAQTAASAAGKLASAVSVAGDYVSRAATSAAEANSVAKVVAGEVNTLKEGFFIRHGDYAAVVGALLILAVGASLFYAVANRAKQVGDQKKNLQAFSRRDNDLAVVKQDIESLQRSNRKIVGAVLDLRDRTENLEAAVELKKFSFDDEAVRRQLLADIRATKPGEVYEMVFLADGAEYKLDLHRQPGNEVMIPKGIKGYRTGDVFVIDGLIASLRKAVYQGRLDPMVDISIPTLRDVVPLKQAA